MAATTTAPSPGRVSPVPALVFVALLVALTIVPREKVLGGGSGYHNGIAAGGVTISLYGLAIAGLALLFALSGVGGGARRRLPVAAGGFLALLLFQAAFVWGGTDEQTAGVVQLALGVAAWVVGAHLGPSLVGSDRNVRLVATALLALTALQGLVCLLQVAGASINPMSAATAAAMDGRVNGLSDHPNNLGKIVVLTMILALGLLGTTDRMSRRLLWTTVLVAFIPLGLAQGRANLVAAVSVLVLYALLLPGRRSLAMRVGVPLAVVLAVLPFAAAVATRFQEDPEGGDRPHLRAVAMDVIGENPWSGLGPNSFVSVVSKYDAVVAQGYPVHNSFYLTAAELGIPAAVLFWLPVLGLVLLAWRARRRGGYAGAFGTAIVAATPGFYVVLSTGWALLKLSMLPLWFLVLGVAYSQVRRAPAPALVPARAARRPLRRPGPAPRPAAPRPGVPAFRRPGAVASRLDARPPGA